VYYVPIIPFCLVNGISGIGTGFSCNIPSYNPAQIVLYLQRKLRQDSTSTIEFIPYYEGFKGTVSRIAGDSHKFLIKGNYEMIDANKILITELPVGTWTMNYLSFLEDLMDGDKKKKTTGIVKDFVNMSTEVHVHITVTLEKGKIAELESSKDAYGVNGLEKALKLTTTVSNTNMNMFNSEKQLHKYNSVEEIIDAHFDVRMAMYQKRKHAQVRSMKEHVKELSNRARFIQEVVANTIDLRKLSDDNDVARVLQEKKYDKKQDKYDYLTHMPINNMTKVRVQKILKEKEDVVRELDVLEKTELTTIWLRELDALEQQYKKYKEAREKIMSKSIIEKESTKTGGGKRKKN
jgi:DNA topoisomerase II